MTVPKLAGTGAYPIVTEFYAHGFYVAGRRGAAAADRAVPDHALRPLRPAARASSRGLSARPSRSTRITGGVNVGIGESLQVKAEYLVNRELEGAPQVANNVFTSSAVWTW